MRNIVFILIILGIVYYFQNNPGKFSELTERIGISDNLFSLENEDEQNIYEDIGIREDTSYYYLTEEEYDYFNNAVLDNINAKTYANVSLPDGFVIIMDYGEYNFTNPVTERPIRVTAKPVKPIRLIAKK